MRRRAIAFFFAALLVLPLLSACSVLLPREEEPLPAPVLRAYEAPDWMAVAVRRETLVLDKAVNVVYRAADEMNLNFSESGFVKRLYVKTGDWVQEGELLAEMERESLLMEVRDAEYEVRRLEQLALNVRDTLALDRELYVLEHLKSTLAGLPASSEEGEALLAQIKAQEDVVANVRSEREFAIARAEKRVEIAERQLDALREEASKYAIYASVSGFVTWTRPFSAEDLVAGGMPVVKLSESGESQYLVTVASDAALLQPGEVYPVTISGEIFEMRAEEIEGRQMINLVPLSAPAGGVGGVIRLELDRRENALILPASAIAEAGGREFVFTLDENGLRTMKYVQTGLTVGGKVEIVTGLEEGEEIIID